MIPIEVSARHLHITEKDFKKLFGNKKLIPIKPLSQPEQFAAKQQVELIGKEKLKARILGPFRNKTQVEISKTDAFRLGINPKLKISGDLKNTNKIKIKGPNGKIEAPVIIAKRHLHLSESEAKKLKLKNNQKIKIKISGERGLTFENVIVRSGKEHKMAFQIDTDEGNAAGINKNSKGVIIK